jgi:arginine utilization regulatory protein
MKENIRKILSNYDLEHNIGITELLEDLEDGIMIVDKDFNIIHYNKGMEKIESLKADDVMGKNIYEVFPDKSYIDSTVYQSIKEGKKTVDKIEKYLTYKGTPVSVINSTIPLLKDGEIVAALDINKDLHNLGKFSNINTNKKDVFTKYVFSEILTRDSRMKKAIEHGKKAAMLDSPVLITGQTGTGKELFAQSIHNEGLRKGGPFLALNCAAIPSELMEGILFGTVKGSYTGAVDRAGLFEQADKGTLLLDEINSLNLNLQAKLLRILQEGVFRRIGGEKDIRSDVRIISTSNQNLFDLINENKFRDDLFYRLSVIMIEIPSLKDRGKDVEFLANHFYELLSVKLNQKFAGIEQTVLDFLKSYNWPGNIRELRNVIEGSLCLATENSMIEYGDLPDYLFKPSNKQKPTNRVSSHDANDIPVGNSIHEKMEYYEKKIILEAITDSNGSITKAAENLGLSRQSLQYRMKKLGIDKSDFKTFYNPG